MDHLQEQHKSICGEKFTSYDSTEKKLQEIKQALHTDFYRPEEHPSPLGDSKMYNPAVEIMDDYFTYSDEGWVAESELMWILSHVPEYIPSEDIITYLSSIDKILEIGAGNGYWSHVINMNGGNCIPTDLYPREINENIDNYPVTEGIVNSESITIWSDVIKKKHTHIKEFSGDAVLICHPEGLEWTEEILEFIDKNQKLIVVAEWYPGPDSTPFFFKNLHENFTLLEKYSVLNWDYSDVCCYIFQK